MQEKESVVCLCSAALPCQGRARKLFRWRKVLSHNGVKHQPFLSILNVLELLASTAMLRWERVRRSCWGKLVQIVSVPRSVFEQSPLGHELLSARLGLAGASGRGRARFHNTGLAHQPRRVIHAWGRGKTPHRAELQSELSCPDTNRDARSPGEGRGGFALVEQHRGGVC